MEKNYILVSVEHKSLTMLRVEINSNVVKTKIKNNIHYFKAYENDVVEIFFEPWKILPLIRFGNHLVNYGIAQINQWDHKLDFKVDLEWDDHYFNTIVANKKEYIQSKGHENTLLSEDAYLGVNSYHGDMVKQIESKL
jgi:hypothetical protein